MKVEYVTPFVKAAVAVFESLLGKTAKRGSLSARPEVFTTQQVNIVCGVTGDVEGQVIYGMSMATADHIASGMLGRQIDTFDQLAASAIAELGNMISGNGMALLSEQGFRCEITPPTIIKGTNVRISAFGTPALVIPLTIKDLGSLEINLCLRERESITRTAA